MFFDNASTTKISDNIMSELGQINEKFFYNPGGLYAGGRGSRAFLDKCRKDILSSLDGEDGFDLIFTGSATESNNLALFGSVKKNARKILVSMGEHPSVFNTALELRQRGFDVEFVGLDGSGRVDINDFKEKMTRDVELVSIMHTSNETGAINDISRLVEIAKSVNKNVVFHCDGVQACGKIDVSLSELGVDMYTISAHKIHGFKGTGGLFVRKGLKLKPIVFGGGQESGLRSGTENIIGIYSLARAVQMSTENLEKNRGYVSALKNKFVDGLDKSGLDFVLHSDESASPYIVSVSFLGCRAETLLNMLSDIDIYVGNGSACSSKNSGNRVLENMGASKEEITSNLRISFSIDNTFDEIDVLVSSIKTIVEKYLENVR